MVNLQIFSNYNSLHQEHGQNAIYFNVSLAAFETPLPRWQAENLVTLRGAIKPWREQRLIVV